MATRFIERALVIDDDRLFANMSAFLLHCAGVETVVVRNDAESAWDDLMGSPVDLILSDWNMEPTDGYQFLKRVRSHRRTANIPFILMTANTSDTYEDMAMTAGASVFLPKPFSVKQLAASVATAWAASGFQPEPAPSRNSVGLSGRLQSAPVRQLRRLSSPTSR